VFYNNITLDSLIFLNKDIAGKKTNFVIKNQEVLKSEFLCPHLEKKDFNRDLFSYDFTSSDYYQQAKNIYVIISGIEFSTGKMTNVRLCDVVNLDKKKMYSFFYDGNK